jgi:hypothetical protein
MAPCCKFELTPPNTTLLSSHLDLTASLNPKFLSVVGNDGRAGRDNEGIAKVGRYESRSDMGVVDGVYGVTSGESSGVPAGLISEVSRSFRTSTGSSLTLMFCFLCRFRYPDTPPWNQETCKHPARKSEAAGTHDPLTIAREDGRKQSIRSIALYSIRMRKKDERNRKSFRIEGKRFDNAKSRVGI